MKDRQTIAATSLLRLAVILLLGSAPAFGGPAWWTTRAVINPGLPADDYAKINLGQLKHMAAEARNELNASLIGGAGSTIDSLVNGWANVSGADDYAICNIGQIKAVSKLYWDRLIAQGIEPAYPWTAVTSDDDEYAIANLGQLKNAFDFETNPDRDGDGLSNIVEKTITGTDPTKWDSNNNGISDAMEDPDGDMMVNIDEVNSGWNPSVNDFGDPTRAEAHTYDGANRLLTAKIRSGVGMSTVTYTPDAAGNLIQANHP